MNTASRFAAGLVLATTCAVASAQTTPSAPASQPEAVGVSPETARAANEQAVKRSDVATVVKTGPTVADRARQAEANVDSTVGGTSTTAGATGTSTADGTTMAANTGRAPRADRN